MTPTINHHSTVPAGYPVERGIPFSTRMDFGAWVDPAPVVSGNREFIRAWTIRRSAVLAAPLRRTK